VNNLLENKMELKDCKHGILVKSSNGEIGMIVGITNNCTSGDISTRSEPERAIPLIQWQSGETRGCHHGNLSVLK
jgi:hypothetical protein